jgi:hypothetical protein
MKCLKRVKKDVREGKKPFVQVVNLPEIVVASETEAPKAVQA